MGIEKPKVFLGIALRAGDMLRMGLGMLVWRGGFVKMVRIVTEEERRINGMYEVDVFGIKDKMLYAIGDIKELMRGGLVSPRLGKYFTDLVMMNSWGEIGKEFARNGNYELARGVFLEISHSLLRMYEEKKNEPNGCLLVGLATRLGDSHRKEINEIIKAEELDEIRI